MSKHRNEEDETAEATYHREFGDNHVVKSL